MARFREPIPAIRNVIRVPLGMVLAARIEDDQVSGAIPPLRLTGDIASSGSMRSAVCGIRSN